MDFFTVLSDQKEEISSFQPALYVKRQEESEVNLKSPRAQVVIGVRRCGKSTLCKKVLVEAGVNFAYVNFDDERLAQIKADDLNDILLTLYRLYGDFSHLLLDEIQNIESWPLFVNRLLRQGIKLVVTGSNANLLSGELLTHLTGRHKQITLFPFSFAEYCCAVGVDAEKATTKAAGIRQNALDRYLMEGGLPESIHDSPGEAEEYARELLHTVVYKDICTRYKVKYVAAVGKLANIVMEQCCQPISVRQLAEDLAIKSPHTIENYLQYMENAFLVLPVERWSYKSVQRRIFPKGYVVDNSFLSHHDKMLQSDNLGWRLENIIAVELMRRLKPGIGTNLYYLRQSKDYEVDFAVVDGGKTAQLIQVSYDFENPSRKLYNREIGGLLKGAAATGCDDLTLVVMKGEPGIVEKDGREIQVVRAMDWLLGSQPK